MTHQGHTKRIWYIYNKVNSSPVKDSNGSYIYFYNWVSAKLTAYRMGIQYAVSSGY